MPKNLKKFETIPGRINQLRLNKVWQSALYYIRKDQREGGSNYPAIYNDADFYTDETVYPIGEITTNKRIKDLTNSFNHPDTLSGYGYACDGVANELVGGDCGEVKTIELILACGSTSEQILDLNGSESIEVSSGTITLNGAWTGNTVYVDGVKSSTLDTDYHHVCVTLTTAIEASAVVAAHIGANYGEVTFAAIRLWAEAFDPSDVAWAYANPEKLVTERPGTSLVATDLVARPLLGSASVGNYILNPVPANYMWELTSELDSGEDFSATIVMSGGKTLDWDMGDGTQYLADNTPEHTYSSDGPHTVKVDKKCASNVTSVTIAGNELTGPVLDFSANTAITTIALYNNNLEGTVPDFSANTALSVVSLYSNNLSGPVPDFSANTALTKVFLHGNNLEGTVPDFSANTALTHLYLGDNNLEGTIPDFSANTALSTLALYSNSLEGFSGELPVVDSASVLLQDNALTQAAVDNVLAALVESGAINGTLNLSGGTNAIPSAAGLADKAILEGDGWTVTVNS